MIIQELLEEAGKRNASDLHLVAGSPPVLRIDGALVPLSQLEVIVPEEMERLLFSIVTPEQKEIFIANKELDFSFASGNSRLRINYYFQKAQMAAAFRILPLKIRTIEELHVPQICHQFAQLRQGFVLITGPTGHGKSTTLAAIIDEINQTRACHILTIEDPIEYLYGKGKSIVSQREMNLDTHSWDIALRAALREDPDVVLIGEMRDFETIAAALTIAETGHLVFATLHTNSAAQTIDRIVDTFPENSKGQTRIQIAGTLEAILSQRLIPSLEGGRFPACEILLATSAVRSTIREGKTHLIDNIIQTSMDLGMLPLENSLAELVKNGKINLETAQSFALRPEALMRNMETRKK